MSQARHLSGVKSTYTIKELQRETAAAVRLAESGALVTITRHDHPVVHVISDERLGALLETMELLTDPDFVAAWKLEKAGKGKYYPASSLAD
jgi:antitoxin (DNA-binding transcriptional repressor) of toxin-antitoxin stability system